uniref:Urease accessory protein UreG n=1 Tax=Anthurium amnicola TaxID=1678845 RepID=A0A1D1XGA1_9ARAE
MLLKSKTFPLLVTLTILVYCLVSSHAYIVRRDLATGTQAVANFNNLGGKITFTKLDTGGTGLNGQFTKGITDSNPKNYVLQIGDLSSIFSDINIQVTPPGTDPFTPAFPVLFDDFVGKTILVQHSGQTIDQATFTL